MHTEMRERIKKLKLVISDCDGVLTDGGLYYLENGQEIKRFHVLDGMGFLMLRRYGIKTGLITGENNPLVKKRVEKLKLDYAIFNTKDKLGALQSICAEMKIGLGEAAYMGDDIFDIPAIRECGFGAAPADALSYVRDSADYVAEKGGGRGCFREIADLILLEKGIKITEEIKW